MSCVLIIAYHFPPCTGSSGVLRPLKFARYLPEFGWQPVVLTIHPRAYEESDPRSESSVPAGLPVLRAFALDAKRHLGFRGLYQDWMALPDRWATWLLGAVPSGLRAIRKYRIEVLFTTFPISTALLIGLLLHLITGKPWVVDFRDSMTEDNYPHEAFRRRIWRWIERKVMRHASRVIFTAAATRRMYLRRYPELSPEKCLLITNGYDEEDFASLQASAPAPAPADRTLQLLHTGMLYREERDPLPFFRAVARLRSEGRLGSHGLRIVFRNPSSEAFYGLALNELGIADIVALLPQVPHREALQECADADGLLLFQAANCDHQIPAKAYEYLRLRKPVFALTTYTGETAVLLEEVGGATIANLAEEEEIYRVFPAFLEAVRTRTHALADPAKIARYARRSQAESLAACLSEVKNEFHLATARENRSLAR